LFKKENESKFASNDESAANQIQEDNTKNEQQLKESANEESLILQSNDDDGDKMDSDINLIEGSVSQQLQKQQQQHSSTTTEMVDADTNHNNNSFSLSTSNFHNLQPYSENMWTLSNPSPIGPSLIPHLNTVYLYDRANNNQDNIQTIATLSNGGNSGNSGNSGGGDSTSSSSSCSIPQRPNTTIAYEMDFFDYSPLQFDKSFLFE
jgi:hypothetical protein